MPNFDLTKLFVNMINGMTGIVELTASDVHALPDDTQIPQPATAAPSDLGTAAVGTSAKYAREDHVHDMPDYGAQTTYTSGTHDLNTFTTPGLYYFSGGTTLSHQPSSAGAGWLLVLKTNSTAYKQIWFRNSTTAYNQQYVRMGSSGTWYDWIRFTTEDKLREINKSLSNATVASGSTVVNVGSYQLPKAGSYQIMFRGRFATNSSGVRQLAIATSNSSMTNMSDCWVNQNACSSDNTVLQVAGCITTTGAKTIYFNARQTSGSSLTLSSIYIDVIEL